jgi:hypothetical protein
VRAKVLKWRLLSSLSQKHIEIVVIHFLNITKAYFYRGVADEPFFTKSRGQYVRTND